MRNGWIAILLLAAAAACAREERAPEPAAAPPAAPPTAGAAAAYPRPDGAWDVNRAAFEEHMRRAAEERLHARGAGERISGFGRAFLGLPYVAHTLDLPGEERLVVNLKELDCVTLVENALALSFSMERGGAYDEFLAALERIRYRSGRLDGYTSRLHYFSDWLRDNERKGLLRDLTRELGGVPYEKEIHFVSSNQDAYPALRDNPALVDSMRLIEAQLNRETRYWIPEDRIEEVAPRIREGDIIAITTRIDGLDISHTGLATWVDGRLHLLHAPDVGHPVEVSAQPLADKVRAHRLQNGIMVARAP